MVPRTRASSFAQDQLQRGCSLPVACLWGERESAPWILQHGQRVAWATAGSGFCCLWAWAIWGSAEAGGMQPGIGVSSPGVCRPPPGHCISMGIWHLAQWGLAANVASGAQATVHSDSFWARLCVGDWKKSIVVCTLWAGGYCCLSTGELGLLLVHLPLWCFQFSGAYFDCCGGCYGLAGSLLEGSHEGSTWFVQDLHVKPRVATPFRHLGSLGENFLVNNCGMYDCSEKCSCACVFNLTECGETNLEGAVELGVMGIVSVIAWGWGALLPMHTGAEGWSSWLRPCSHVPG